MYFSIGNALLDFSRGTVETALIISA